MQPNMAAASAIAEPAAKEARVMVHPLMSPRAERRLDVAGPEDENEAPGKSLGLGVVLGQERAREAGARRLAGGRRTVRRSRHGPVSVLRYERSPAIDGPVDAAGVQSGMSGLRCRGAAKEHQGGPEQGVPDGA